jgi:hypothetical protein
MGACRQTADGQDQRRKAGIENIGMLQIAGRDARGPRDKNQETVKRHLKHAKIFGAIDFRTRLKIPSTGFLYMRNAAKVIRVMAKLRDEAERFIHNIVFR